MKRTLSYKLNIFLFLLPALILFVGILIAPIVMSAYYSFHDFNSIASKSMNFVWLDNYKELFSRTMVNAETGKAFVNDKFMGDALVNSLILAALSVFIQLPLSLAIALKLSKHITGERFYLSIFFMPVLISTVIIGRLWMNIYDPGKAGILNAGLKALGIDQWLFPWISKQITSSKLQFTGQWTGFKETALIAAFIPILWQYVGYHMLLMYAGIRGVPNELLEAAKLDGCRDGQVNRYIIIPYIKPILKVSVIFAVTGSLKSFDLIYTLMKDTTKAELPSTLMYKLLFLHNRYGLGSAIAVILIVLCFIFALLISLAFRDRGEKVS
ncbi:MAG: sugar ABC transporter permease [Clostridia bacterium]|nr:sugar ABC transporter permease [Clostridia bacterium]